MLCDQRFTGLSKFVSMERAGVRLFTLELTTADGNRTVDNKCLVCLISPTTDFKLDESSLLNKSLIIRILAIAYHR